MNIPILYEDNHILVVEKPPNIPVQEDSSRDPDVLTLLKGYIKEKYQKPGAVYLGLVHRLDRPVGGVMVFARTSKAAKRLTEQFAARQAKKRYVAIVEGEAPQQGQWKDWILKEGERGAAIAAMGTPGAKEASLSFCRLAVKQGLSLLDVALHTGRKHQIRLQLSSHGYPILHDQRYHPKAKPGNQICLWAYSLQLEHPTRKERMTFCSLPKGGPWNGFATQIAALPAWEACVGVYQDENLLCVAKRAGLEAVTADGGEDSLEARLTPLFGRLYPLHRLDANTQGLILFARNPQAYEALDEALRQGNIQKTYRCVGVGRPPKEQDVITQYCEKDGKAAKLSVFSAPGPGRKIMKTGYRVENTQGPLCLLEVRLYTGRTHQIRAHLAYLGCPVLGDDKYGDREANRRYHARRQMLLSYQMELALPQDGPIGYLNGKVFCCPWELDFPEENE